MNNKIEYQADKGMVVVTQAGETRYASVVKELPEIGRLMEKHHTHLAAFDLRATALHLSVPEVYFVTKQLADLGILPGSRFAFVCPPSEANAELYEFCALAARNRGYRTRLFETMEAGEAWLREAQRPYEEDAADEAAPRN